MESLGDILKRKSTPTNTSGVNTDTWSNASQGEEDVPDPNCPLCKGSGFVHPLLASNRPDFSRVRPCPCTTKELQKKQLNYLERYSNLGPLSRFTFDNLSPRGRWGNATSQKHFTLAYEAAKVFASNPQNWLVFLGPTGCGKTHLVCAIANYRLSLAQPVFYIRAADLLDHLRSTFSPSSQTPYDELFEQVSNAALLILDDLNTENATAWAKQKLDQLLDHRFNIELPTVITTNVPLERLEESLRSRLADSQFCQVHVIEESPVSALKQLDGLELELLRNMTFENFDSKRLNLLPQQRQNLEQAFHIALDFAQSPQGWLVFQGGNGCGKTHLACAIANYRLQAGEPALFIVVADLLDYLRSTFSPDSKVSYDKVFEQVKKTPLLILDDFGEQSTTPWAQEKLYQLINYRYNARLPTVITTCFSLEEIEARISSRMVDPSLSLVFNITVPDYRGDINVGRDTRTPRRYLKRGRRP